MGVRIFVTPPGEPRDVAGTCGFVSPASERAGEHARRVLRTGIRDTNGAASFPGRRRTGRSEAGARRAMTGAGLLLLLLVLLCGAALLLSRGLDRQRQTAATLANDELAGAAVVEKVGKSKAAEGADGRTARRRAAAMTGANLGALQGAGKKQTYRAESYGGNALTPFFSKLPGRPGVRHDPVNGRGRPTQEGRDYSRPLADGRTGRHTRQAKPVAETVAAVRPLPDGTFAFPAPDTLAALTSNARMRETLLIEKDPAGDDALRGVWIAVDKRRFAMTVFMDARPLRRFPVGLGRHGATPSGRYRIVNKLTNPDWYNRGETVKAGDPENPLGKRWMGLGAEDGPTRYGIHPTDEPGSIGRAESRGCIRMRPDDAETVFRLCPIGTPVIIGVCPEPC